MRLSGFSTDLALPTNILKVSTFFRYLFRKFMLIT